VCACIFAVRYKAVGFGERGWEGETAAVPLRQVAPASRARTPARNQ
jgi:hypothetical protein